MLEPFGKRGAQDEKTKASQAIVGLLPKSDKPALARDVVPLVFPENAIDSFPPELPLLQLTGGCRLAITEVVLSAGI